MTTGLQATIDKSALLRLLSVVREAASFKAGALPVYQMVRLDASAGYLRATCFMVTGWSEAASLPRAWIPGAHTFPCAPSLMWSTRWKLRSR